MIAVGGYMQNKSLVVLVRHIESVRNFLKAGEVFVPDEALHKLQGIPDHRIHTTERGYEQGLATGVGLRQSFGKFDVVFDSGYVRTITTKESILKAYSKEELVDTEFISSGLIREKESGYTHSMTESQVKQYFPWFQEYYQTFGPYYTRPPGGESASDLCDGRVGQFVHSILPQYKGKKVMVVTHGNTIRSLRSVLEGWSPEEYEQRVKQDGEVLNCATFVYEYEEKISDVQLIQNHKLYW